jgi:hypothetical protein
MSVAGDVLSMTGVNGIGSHRDRSESAHLRGADRRALVWVNTCPTHGRSRSGRGRCGLALGLAMAAAILQISAPSPFLYFQF